MQKFIKNRAREAIFTLDEYIPGKPIDEVKRELGLVDIIKLASNENPLGPSPLAIKALEGELRALNLYPDANCYLLKQKIAQHMEVIPQSVLIGNGSDELLRLIAQTFINQDDEVILARPTFSEYEFTAKIMGARCIRVPLENYKYDLKGMLAAISGKTKIIYLCNPNNPTGTFLTADETELLLQEVPGSLLVVFDEAYIEYADDKKVKSALRYLKGKKNIIILRTLSKLYGLAGLRVGYAVTHPEIAAAVRRTAEPFSVNSLAQAAATAALDDVEHVKNTLELNRQGKEYLYKEFDLMGLDYVPTQANFIWVDTGREAETVFEPLLKMGVIIREGSVFGYPRHIRVTIGDTGQNFRFIAALKTVLRG